MHCLCIKVSIKKVFLRGFSHMEYKILEPLSFPGSPSPFLPPQSPFFQLFASLSPSFV